MLTKVVMLLVILVGTFNAALIMVLRRSAVGFQRAVYFHLSLSNLAIVAQSAMLLSGFPHELSPHRIFVELSVFAWSITSVVGMSYALAHRPSSSSLSRILDIVIACLGVFVLIWTTAVSATFSSSNFGTEHTIIILASYFSIAACTGLSLTLSRVSSAQGRPRMIANIAASILIAFSQTLLLLNLHSVHTIPTGLIYLMTLTGFLVFGITHSPQFRKFTLRFPTKLLHESMGFVLYIPILAFPVVAVFIDRGDPVLTFRNLLLSILVILLIARIRLFEAVAHRRREALERRIQQRTSELAAAHELLLQIMDVAEDGMIAIDGGNQPLLLNRSARMILQLTGTPSTDQTVDDPVRIDENPILEIFDAARESQELGRRVQREILIAGRSRHLEILVRRINDSSERLVAVFRDVTDDISLLQKKSRFISMVSHEIRTPLTSLSGSLSLVRSGALGEIPSDAGRMIDIASSSTERLVRLVNDVLIFNRLEAERTSINFHPTNAHSVIQEAIDAMQPLANSKCQVVEGFGGLDEIHLDRDRIHQVLINLIQNALKFSPSISKVIVSARIVDDEIEFEVADEGRGIPDASIESIFEPFYQVDGSDSRVHSGTGLGLAICRGIVELHGGRIWAENRIPRGTSVKFRIPRGECISPPMLEMVAS